MANTQAVRSVTPADLMRARGGTLGALLREERWSNRKAAERLGLTHTYVGSRINGEVDITFSDIEAFAELLKMQPVDLFARLERAANDALEGVKLPGLDSNQEPIDSQSAVVLSLAGRTPRPKKPSPMHGPAIVSQLRLNA